MPPVPKHWMHQRLFPRGRQQEPGILHAVRYEHSVSPLFPGRVETGDLLVVIEQE